MGCAKASPRTPLKLKSKVKKKPGVDSCWHVAALGFLTTFFITITVSNSSFFYLGFIQEYGVTREAATWPSSVIWVLSHLSGLPLAALQRRVSLYKIFLLGGLLSWVGVLASAFVPTMAWMAVTLGAIHGLGIGIIAIALSILLSLYFDKYRCLTQGIKYAGASCAGLIFPKLFAYLQQEYGFRGTLLIYGGITMHVSALCLLLKEPSWIVVTDFTGAAYLSTLVDYAVDKGLSIEDAESLVIYGSCSEFVGRLFLPLMADAGCIRRSTLVTVNFFVWGCSMMLMPYATIHVHIIIVCSFVYLASGCLQPMRSVLIADYIGVQWLSTCYTFSGFILLPLIFCNPSIIGFFRDARGSYDGLYRLYGGIHLLVSVLFLAVVCIERRHSSIWTLSENTQEKNWWK
ncbi:monocarboxylate transporter 13-like [Ixodes scapularis]